MAGINPAISPILEKMKKELNARNTSESISPNNDVSLDEIKLIIREKNLEILDEISKESDLLICSGIEDCKISSLKIPNYYCREEIDDKRDRLKNEIESKGFIGSIIVNHHPEKGMMIIDGVERMKIMHDLGRKHIPVQFIRTLSIEVEKTLSIDLNTSVNDFNMEEFGLNFKELDLCEFGFDESDFDFTNDMEDKAQEIDTSKNTKVIKYVKIGGTLEECEWMNKVILWYKKEFRLANKKEALMQILSKLNYDEK